MVVTVSDACYLQKVGPIPRTCKRIKVYAEHGCKLLLRDRTSTSYEAYSPTDVRAEIEFNSKPDEITGLPDPELSCWEGNSRESKL